MSMYVDANFLMSLSFFVYWNVLSFPWTFLKNLNLVSAPTHPWWHCCVTRHLGMEWWGPSFKAQCFLYSYGGSYGTFPTWGSYGTFPTINTGTFEKNVDESRDEAFGQNTCRADGFLGFLISVVVPGLRPCPLSLPLWSYVATCSARLKIKGWGQGLKAGILTRVILVLGFPVLVTGMCY